MVREAAQIVDSDRVHRLLGSELLTKALGPADHDAREVEKSRGRLAARQDEGMGGLRETFSQSILVLEALLVLWLDAQHTGLAPGRARAAEVDPGAKSPSVRSLPLNARARRGSLAGMLGATSDERQRQRDADRAATTGREDEAKVLGPPLACDRCGGGPRGRWRLGSGPTQDSCQSHRLLQQHHPDHPGRKALLDRGDREGFRTARSRSTTTTSTCLASTTSKFCT